MLETWQSETVAAIKRTTPQLSVILLAILGGTGSPFLEQALRILPPAGDSQGPSTIDQKNPAGSFHGITIVARLSPIVNQQTDESRRYSPFRGTF